jgi:hypothetical protein
MKPPHTIPQFYSGHIGEAFGRNEYGSLIRQAIVSMRLIVTLRCVKDRHPQTTLIWEV